MARPFKDPQLRMDTDLRIPVTAEQKTTIQGGAAVAGLDMAAWARPILLEAARQELAKSKGKKRRSTE